MSVAETWDPVVAIRAEARQARELPMPMRACRSLMTMWLRYREQRLLRAIYALDHPGVLEDFRAASRR